MKKLHKCQRKTLVRGPFIRTDKRQLCLKDFSQEILQSLPKQLLLEQSQALARRCLVRLRCSKKFHKIQIKAPLLESLF